MINSFINLCKESCQEKMRHYGAEARKQVLATARRLVVVSNNFNVSKLETLKF